MKRVGKLIDQLCITFYILTAEVFQNETVALKSSNVLNLLFASLVGLLSWNIKIEKNVPFFKQKSLYHDKKPSKYKYSFRRLGNGIFNHLQF